MLATSVAVAYTVNLAHMKKETKETMTTMTKSMKAQLLEEYDILMRVYSKKIYNVYKENYDELVKTYENGFEKSEDKKAYYKALVASIFPPEGMMGLSYETSQISNEYTDLRNTLDFIATSEDYKGAYVYFYDAQNDYIVYLVDSKSEVSYDYNYPGSISKPGADTKEYILNSYNREGGYFEDFEDCVAAMPVYDDPDGNYKIYIELRYSYDEILNRQADFIKILVIASIATTGIIAIIFYLIINGVLVENIRKLNKSTQTYIDNLKDGKLEKISSGIKTRDEIGELSKQFDTLQTKIENYIDDLNKRKSDEEKIKAELDIASKIQLETLPNNTLDNELFKIENFIKPAKEVGGDLYNYYMIDDTHLFFTIADVSGKGVPAALFMMRCSELIKSITKHDYDISKMAYEVNNALCYNNSECLFITAFMGILDTQTNVLTYVRCGHEQPYLLRDGTCSFISPESNVFLGAYEDEQFIKESLQMQKGDKLLLYTDGLNEGINDNNEEFGYDRIKEVFENCESDVISALYDNLMKFCGSTPQFDDISMLLLTIKDDEIEEHHLENPDFNDIQKLTSDILEKSKTKEYNEDKIGELGVILDDILNNYVSYAFENIQTGYLDVKVKYGNEKICLDIIDNGMLFNPLDLSEPDVDIPMEEREQGGLGVFLVKQFSDSVSYNIDSGKNHLTIIKTMI